MTRTARRGRAYTSAADIPRRSGWTVTVPGGLFDGPAIYWHRLEQRARDRAARLIPTIADVTIKPMEPPDATT